VVVKRNESRDRIGMFALVLQALGVFAQHGNNVYIDFSNKSPYQRGKENVWENYFEQACSKYGKRVEKESTFMYHPYTFYTPFNGQAFHPAQRAWARALICRYIKLKPQLSSAIEKFAAENMSGKKVLGVQARVTENFKVHAKGNDRQKFIDSLRDKVAPHAKNYDAIYLMTDSAQVKDLFDKWFQNVLFYDKAYLSSDYGAIHWNKKNDGYKVGEDVIIGTYILSKCDFLLAMRSNISLFALLKGEMKYIFVDDDLNYPETAR
jgi:hypothetical protein